MVDIKNYEGLYAITSCGKVWSYRSKKFLKPRNNGYGYFIVSLYNKCNIRKNYQIHRLVAEAYIPNPNNYETVDHIDSNKTNNCIKNLQWMNRKENTIKANGMKIKCIETGMIFKSQSEAARYYSIPQPSISQAIRGKYHTAGNYHWEVI